MAKTEPVTDAPDSIMSAVVEAIDGACLAHLARNHPGADRITTEEFNMVLLTLAGRIGAMVGYTCRSPTDLQREITEIIGVILLAAKAPRSMGVIVVGVPDEDHEAGTKH